MQSGSLKEFFDASVFLGMNGSDEETRRACKNFFAGRFQGVLLTSLDQVGLCDDLIWRYSRELQDAYYPFMDQLHSRMRIVREAFSETELRQALADPRLEGLSAGDRLLLGKVMQAGGLLYSARPRMTKLDNLPVRAVQAGPEMSFPSDLDALYQTSLQLRIPAEDLQ